VMQIREADGGNFELRRFRLGARRCCIEFFVGRSTSSQERLCLDLGGR